MTIELLNSCLDILHTHGLESETFHSYFTRIRYDLLGDEAVAAALVMAVGHFDEGNDEAIWLFSLLLDEARMGIENDSAFGQVFLSNVEDAIGAGLADGTIKQHHLLKFAGQYRRVDLKVPDILTLDPEKMEGVSDTIPSDLEGNLENLATEIQQDGGGPYELFNALHEMTAAMPEDMQAGFVNHLATFANPLFERCVLYWLLSGSPLIQEAAAVGLLEKLKRSALQSGTLLFLPIIRGWLPAGSARDCVDDLNKHARRKGHSSVSEHQETSIIQDITASITDGVGAQSIIIMVKRQKKTFVAMLLTKTGYGIKDAFVITCRTNREAQNIVMQARQQASGARINRATAELFLEAAMADGLENDCMPAPGFVDVMEICDLHGLRPQKKELLDLLELADADHEIRTAPSAKFKRMLNNEVALDALFPFTDSWFEDSAETRSIIQGSRQPKNIETKMWKYLEARRAMWARRFLQTSIMLKDAKMDREARLLTASAFALMDDQPLREIPLMDNIVFTTLAAGGVPVFWQ